MGRVSAEWRRFGTLLGISRNQLKAWDRENRGDVTMCWEDVMEHWLSGGGTHDYPATWEGLYTLLRDCNFSTVAADLQMAVSECHAPSH